MANLTTTSYAILGLLNLRPWSGYELTQQAARSMRYVWPKSESHLYAEQKRLVELGVATVRDEPAGPRRTRQVYRITPKGRRALRDWLASEPAPPQMECEAMVRLLFADVAGKDEVLAALAATRRDVQQAYDDGLEIVRGYARGEAPFPERLHISVLVGAFARDVLQLVQRWMDFAAAEVQRWPATDGVGMDDRTREILDALVADRPVLTQDGRRPAGRPRGGRAHTG